MKDGKGLKAGQETSSDEHGGLNQDSDDDGIDAYGGPPSNGASNASSRPPSALDEPASSVLARPDMSPRSPTRLLQAEMNIIHQAVDGQVPERDDQILAGNNEQTTLLHNEEEGFALAPVDTTAVKGKFSP